MQDEARDNAAQSDAADEPREDPPLESDATGDTPARVAKLPPPTTPISAPPPSPK